MSTDGPCNCVTSKMFPHRMSKCSMKKTVSNVSSFNPANSLRNLVNQAEIAAMHATHTRPPAPDRNDSMSESRYPGPGSPTPVHSPSTARSDRTHSSVSPAETSSPMPPHAGERLERTHAAAHADSGLSSPLSPVMEKHLHDASEGRTVPAAPAQSSAEQYSPVPHIHPAQVAHFIEPELVVPTFSAEPLSIRGAAAAPTESAAAVPEPEILPAPEETTSEVSEQPVQDAPEVSSAEEPETQAVEDGAVVTPCAVAMDNAPLLHATHVFVPEEVGDAESHVVSVDATADDSEPIVASTSAGSAGRDSEDLNAQCRCVTSKVFPHRVGKCSMRRTSSAISRQAAPAPTQTQSAAAVAMPVPATAVESEYLRKAEKLESPGGTYAVPPRTDTAAPTKKSAAYADHAEVGASGVSAEGSGAVRMAPSGAADELPLCRESNTLATPEEGKPKDPPCKCASSKLFPHRRSKCQLRKTSNDVTKTVKSVSESASKLVTRKKKPARSSENQSAEAAAALVPMPTHVLLRAPQDKAATTLLHLVKTTGILLLSLCALLLMSFGATNLVLHLAWRLFRRLLRV